MKRNFQKEDKLYDLLFIYCHYKTKHKAEDFFFSSKNKKGFQTCLYARGGGQRERSVNYGGVRE